MLADSCIVVTINLPFIVNTSLMELVVVPPGLIEIIAKDSEEGSCNY